MMIQMKRSRAGQSGFSIVEVMVAIAIFAVGMLALGFLQSSLTRSQADANARVVATNLAERLIEQAKGFSVLGQSNGTATAGAFAYNEITEANIAALVGSPTLGGVQYTVAPNVVDFRWNGTAFVCYQGEFDNAGDTNRCVTGNPPAGAGSFSDYKLLELTVNWTGAEFNTDDGVATTNRLGSGSITLGSFISSVTSPTSAKVQTGGGNGNALPPIAYTPSTDPGVVPLALGNNRLKESTLPAPIVSGNLGQTTWDVITYVSGNNGSTFRRREEFRTVACTCAFAASGEANEPVVWAGDEYTDGARVSKVRGVSTDTNRFCERCCEDHHDSSAGSSGYQQYSPFRSDRTASGNHTHYNFDTLTGLMVPVSESAGNAYLESCRMVRAGGYFRVAQDLRAEQQFMVPEEWLVTTGQIADYSGYLTGTDLDDGTTDSAIEEFVDAISASGSGYPTTMPTWVTSPATPSLPPYGAASPTALGAGEFPVWTSVTTSTTNQLRSRALYVDYMTPDLLSLIECLEGSETVDQVKAKNGCSVGSNIGVGSVVLDQFPTNNALEVMPFFEVQLTGLNVWSTATPVDVTSQAIANNGAYSRGLTTATSDATRDVVAQMRKGNNGLLDVTPRVPDVVEPLMLGTLEVVAGTGVGPPPPPPGSTTVGGGITTAQGLRETNMSIAVVGSNNATNCSASFSLGWSCVVADFTASPSVTIQFETTGAGNCMSSSTGDLTVSTVSGVATILLAPGAAQPATLIQPLEIRKNGC